MTAPFPNSFYIMPIRGMSVLIGNAAISADVDVPLHPEWESPSHGLWLEDSAARNIALRLEDGSEVTINIPNRTQFPIFATRILNTGTDAAARNLFACY